MSANFVLQPNWSTRSFGIGIAVGCIITAVAIPIIGWLLGVHVV